MVKKKIESGKVKGFRKVRHDRRTQSPLIHQTIDIDINSVTNGNAVSVLCCGQEEDESTYSAAAAIDRIG